jgi:hypothetical protein
MRDPLNEIGHAYVEATVRAAGAEAAFALGLVRVLTLLPLHDPALDEVEQRLAVVWESLLELRRLIECDETPRCSSHEGDRP